MNACRVTGYNIGREIGRVAAGVPLYVPARSEACHDRLQILRRDRHMIARLLGSLVLSAALIPIATTAGAVDIRMIASNAVKEPYLELVPQFEKASSHHVSIDWVGTDDVVRRVGGGGVADIVIAPSFTIDA